MFDTKFRSTLHGVSAASGKAGAIVGAFAIGKLFLETKVGSQSASILHESPSQIAIVKLHASPHGTSLGLGLCFVQYVRVSSAAGPCIAGTQLLSAPVVKHFGEGRPSARP